MTFVNKTNIEQSMASVLDELIEELQAKQKRIDKEIINLDRSSVIPQHYNKADDILVPVSYTHLTLPTKRIV